MKKAQKSLAAFGNSTQRILGSITKIGMVAGTAAAVGIAYMVKQQMASIDATAKMADRLEMATEDIIALRYQAEIMGATADGLDKSLQMFVRRLGEVRMGSGEAKDGLEALGITADELVDLDTIEALRRVADGIAGIEKSADKAAISYKLFGRQGMQLLNMLEGGSKDMARFMAEAEKLGLLYTRAEAARVEAANDAATKLKRLFVGLSQTLTIQLAPIITNIAEGIIKWATEGATVKQKFIDILEKMTLGILEVGNTVELAAIKWKAFTIGVHEGIAAIYQLCDAMTNLDELFGKFTYKALAEKHLEIAAKMMKELNSETNDYINSVLKVNEFYAGLRKNAEENANTITNSFREISDQLEKTIKQLEEQVEFFGLTGWDLQIAKFQKIAESLAGNELAMFNVQLETMIKLTNELKSKNAMAEAAETAAKSFDTLKSKIESIKESIKTPMERLRDFAETIAEGLKAGLLTMAEARLALEQKVQGMFETTPYTGSLGGMKAITPRYEFATSMPTGTQNISVFQNMQKLLTEVSQSTRRTAENTGDIAREF